MYAENADSSGLNYKHYNLRGDIVATTDSGGSILSELRYLGNGDIKGSSGTQPADKFKHNTKRVEDGFVNEGRRYRDIEMMRFTSPDPLEYYVSRSAGIHRRVKLLRLLWQQPMGQIRSLWIGRYLSCRWGWSGIRFL